MGDLVGEVFAEGGLVPVVVVATAALLGLLVLVLAGAATVRRVAQARLRRRVGRELGVDLPSGFRVRRSQHHRRTGAFLLAYPTWRFALPDGTRDRRRLGNRVLKRWSVLEIGAWRIISQDLFGLYDLVLELRSQGMAVACSCQEQNKLRALDAQVLARRYGSEIDGLVAAFSGRSTNFAPFCADLFRGAGFRAQAAEDSRHGGFDLRLWRDGLSFIVACACYDRRRPVDRSVVQRLQEANVIEGADAMIVMSTSSLSVHALAVAREAGVRVIEGQDLVSMCRRVWGCGQGSSAPHDALVRLTRAELLVGFPADMRHRTI